jgi:hypothetical protein
MTKEITLTKEGGNYWRAWFTHWAIVVMVLPAFLVLTVLAVVNPFWFRSGFMNWVERMATRTGRWRDRVKYRVYLGCDPAVWHALKD